MNVVTLDFETYWDSKNYTLSKMSAIEYVRDLRFYAQMMGVRVNYGPVEVYEYEEIPDRLAKLGLENSDTVVIGHNINGFDGLILSEVYGIKPACILDTMCMMRWCGLSRMMGESLKVMTHYFKCGEKKDGTVVSDGKRTKADFSPEEWEFFKQYCAEDVQQTSDCAFKMFKYMTPDAILFSSITARMATEPSLVLDVDMLREYVTEVDANTAKAREDISHLFHFNTDEEFQKAIRSADKFCAMLRQLGVEPPMKLSEAKTASRKAELEFLAANGSTVAGMMAQADLDKGNYQVYAPSLSKQDIDFLNMQEHPDERVALLVRTRLENNSSIAKSRGEKLIKMALYNKPLPVMLKAFYAHTSRYGAGNSEGKTDGVQIQNLPKRDPKMLKLRKGIRVPSGYKLVAADSSQIEARMLAYLANQSDLLDAFRNKADPYSDLAEKIFNVPSKEIHDGAKGGDKKLKTYRNVGKTAILSCLAGNTQVLTDKGWECINKVTREHKLWDGEQWVAHQGLICNGLRTTISVDGVSMTPEHLIFDGTSWRTAQEYLLEQSYLKSALKYAEEKLSTVDLSLKDQTARCSRNTDLDVTTVDMICGFHNTTSQGLEIPTASIVFQKNALTEVKTLEDSRVGILILNQAKKLESLLLLVQNRIDLFPQEVKADLSEECWSVVHAVQNLIGSYFQTLRTVSLHAVISAQRKKVRKHTLKNIRRMQIYARTQPCAVGYLIASQLFNNGVLIQEILTLLNTVVEALSSSSLTKENVSNTYLLLRDTINQSLNLIVSTMTKVTREIILGSLRAKKMLITGATLVQTTRNLYANCIQELMNLRPVYDIMNSGNKNRFTIKTDSGVLLVHNCGYGVSHVKYSNTLLRQGVKLDDDLDVHAKQAHAAHKVYRDSNRAIVNFWYYCQRVLDHMVAGGEGYFGGPNDDIFHYGMMSMPGSSELVPSIEMPSGYKLRYPNLRQEINEAGKPECYFDKPLGRNIVKTRIYGPMLTENLTQGISFQLLIWQACRMSEVGVNIKGNIHDAFFTVVLEDYAQDYLNVMLQWMKTPPPWLSGIPIDAEGEIADDFTIA